MTAVTLDDLKKQFEEATKNGDTGKALGDFIGQAFKVYTDGRERFSSMVKLAQPHEALVKELCTDEVFMAATKIMTMQVLMKVADGDKNTLMQAAETADYVEKHGIVLDLFLSVGMSLGIALMLKQQQDA